MKLATWFSRYLILFNSEVDWLDDIRVCDEDKRFGYVRVADKDTARELANQLGHKFLTPAKFAEKVITLCGIDKLAGRPPKLKTLRKVFREVGEV